MASGLQVHESEQHGSWNNVKLHGKNGVPTRTYDFKEMRYSGNSGNDYSGMSIRGCAKVIEQLERW